MVYRYAVFSQNCERCKHDFPFDQSIILYFSQVFLDFRCSFFVIQLFIYLLRYYFISFSVIKYYPLSLYEIRTCTTFFDLLVIQHVTFEVTEVTRIYSTLVEISQILYRLQTDFQPLKLFLLQERLLTIYVGQRKNTSQLRSRQFVSRNEQICFLYYTVEGKDIL